VTVADLGEHALLARVLARLPRCPAGVLVGPGDDAAVVAVGRNRRLVVTTDAVVEEVHFSRSYSTPFDIGHRALAANLSDLAAMGATPAWALLSLMLPGACPVADVETLVDGAAALARETGCAIVGGNITRSPGPLVVDVTVGGEVHPRRWLTRGGGRAGDELWLSGTIGAARAGFEMLAAGPGSGPPPLGATLPSYGEVPPQRPPAAKAEVGPPPLGGPSMPSYGASAIAALRAATAESRESEERPVAAAATTATYSTAVDRYRRPTPRVRLGLAIARGRAARAAIDLSDGLADAVKQIAGASGCGAALDADAIPIDQEARAWWDGRGRDPLTEAVRGGDDYELLFAIPPRWGGRLRSARRHAAGAMTRIGVLTKRVGEVRLVRQGKEEPLPEGFEHFRA
jgi:thiamine-monophosphate kinase